MDKILTTSSYGICLFSVEVLQEFLKRNKIRSKKLLDKFQKDDKLYLDTQKEGVWVPFVQINSIGYIIKLEGYDVSFNDEWEQKLEYEGFNIEIKDGLWISSIGSFDPFNAKEFSGDEISYETISYPNHRITVYSAFKYDVPSGKYLLSIKGYARKKRLEFPEPNCGFLFALEKVERFDGFKNPREKIYDFNVAQMVDYRRG